MLLLAYSQMNLPFIKIPIILLVFAASTVSLSLLMMPVNVNAEEAAGSVGLKATISSPPPKTAPTISLPKEGQVFSEMPITASGICEGGLLIKIFKNNVFAGSAQCTNGSYSIQLDLFVGANQLIARGYDALDQASPDSTTVNVTFSNNKPGAGSRVTLTSIYAKRGANPGESMTWPIVISGGEGPYAVSVDWGDGKAPDLKSLVFAGQFDLQHIYEKPGVFNIVIKATDRSNNSAFLQLVGIANGEISQASSGIDDKQGPVSTTTKVMWLPAIVAIILIVIAFLLGLRYEKHLMKKKFEYNKKLLTE